MGHWLSPGQLSKLAMQAFAVRDLLGDKNVTAACQIVHDACAAAGVHVWDTPSAMDLRVECGRIIKLRAKRKNAAKVSADALASSVAWSWRERWRYTLLQVVAVGVLRACNYRRTSSHAHAQNVSMKQYVDASGSAESARLCDGVWCADSSWHSVAIDQQWFTNVYRAGIACVEGLFTLQATYPHSEDGIQFWHAVWVVQGRGFELQRAEGVIAVCGDKRVHGETKAKARARIFEGDNHG